MNTSIIRKRNLILVLLTMMLALVFGMFSAHAESLPKKGQHFYGTATVKDVNIDYSNTGKTTAVFKNHGNNQFAKHVPKYTARCANPGVDDPPKGATYNYTATVTSVSHTTGKVTGTIKYTAAGKLYRWVQNFKTKNKWSYTIPQNIKITLKKESSNPKMTAGNSYYSLKGTVFRVYAKKDKKGNLSDKKGDLTVKDNSGNSNTLSLKKGTYYAKELTAGKGYKKNSKIYTIAATKASSKPYSFTAKNCAGNDPVAVQIEKTDARTNKPVETQPGVLAGAKFQLSYYGDSTKNKLQRKWVFKTDSDGIIKIDRNYYKNYFISGDAFFIDETKKVCFPYGKYTVKEIEAPKGFAIDKKTYPLTLSPNSNATSAIHSTAKIKILEKEARGDISFLKVSEKQKEKVLCQTCEEDITELSEDARTEKHGKNYYCSECGVDKTATHNKEDIEKHIQKTHPKAGGVKASFDKEKGIVLSWDKVDDAESYEIYYSVDDKNYQKIGTSDKTEYVDTGYDRTERTDSYYKVRAIGKTKGQYSDSVKINAYDEIQKAGAETTEPKEPTESSDVSKDDTKESTDKKAETSSQSEETTSSEEKETVKDTDSTKDDKESSSDKDSTDKEETPVIHDKNKATPLTDISMMEEPSVRIRKTVYPDKFVRNNLANVSFTLTNTDTNESHTITTGSDGKYASKSDDSLWFGSAEDKKSEAGKLTAGNYTLTEIKSDANKGLRMIDPVSFVVAKDRAVIDLGTLIDPGNLLYTTATSTDTGDHIAYGDGPISIKDKVEYKGVTIGKEYTVTGTLMDKSTGKEFLDKDGKKITATEKFTATSEEGTVELTFTFDGTKIAKGHKLVAFERMEEEDTLFGIHESIDDKDQTVVFPEVKTTALGNDTKMNLVSGTGNQTIIDTVSYDNVLSGKEYTLKGWLVTKDGKKIDGSDTEKKFTASDEKGNESMYLTFDASKYAGEDVIVYEELYYNGKLVADHKDTSADSQTVHVSKVETKAVNKETKVNVITKTGTQNITDTVSYDNLIPGKTYTLKGYLVNPDNGETISDTAVTKEFTPEKASGTVDMKLSFTQNEDSPLSKVVVFEKLTIKTGDEEVPAGEHKDLTDTNQTLNTVEIGTTAVASDSKTNETSSVNNSGSKEDEPHKNIIDTIHYEGLTPGTKYTAKGWLVDDEGNRIEDGVDGVTDFTPEKSSGDVDVLLSFDASKHAGDDIHVYEEVYVDGVLIGEHKDKDDEGQTVHASIVDTFAVGAKAGINQVGNKGKQEINDSVNYSNLDNTKTYTLKSWAVDKETGKKIDGSESEKTFVPKKLESEESTDLDDSSSEATPDDKEEAKDNISSSDNKDAESTVSAQSENNKDTANSDESNEDTSGNEEAGKDETPSDSKTDEEKPSDSAEDKVQGERVSGTEITTLLVDGEKVKGKILVVFQEVYDENGRLIGEHKDIDSDSQTIYVPEIGTKASLGKLSNLLTGSGKKTVYDTIKYKNLVRDQFYEVTSYLVDKNGTKIPGTDAKTTFSPKKANGEVTVKMTVDTNKLKGKTKLVAFEEIRLKGEFMADHKDVHDKDQTVTIETPTPPSTGDMKKMLPWLILAVVIVGAGGTYYYKKRKSNK